MKKLALSLLAETTDIEFKESLETNKPKSWLKTVSAFANGLGGIIYFGVNDKREITGLKNIKEDIEKISELIKTKIEPMIRFNISIINEYNKNVIKLEILQGSTTPYYYSNDGVKTVFVRIGNESVVAPSHIINELILKGKRLSYDANSSNISFDSVSFTLFKATYKQKTGQVLNEKIEYKSFGLVDDSDMLTYAGILFSDQCPLLQSRIFCTRWNGLEKGSIYEDALDDKEYSGNLISLLENGFNFIKTNNKKSWRKTTKSREEFPDYPERAITEVLVNALIHRSYEIIGSEIHIDIYDDRLEIISPGGMYDGSFIQERDILQIPSTRRNPVIADVFQRLGYMERRGSGFQKIYDAYIDKNKVILYSDRSSFKVTLKNLNFEFQTNKRTGDKRTGDKRTGDKRTGDKIISYLKQNDFITTAIAKELLELKISRTREILASLVEEDKIIREGANRNRKYRLNDKKREM